MGFPQRICVEKTVHGVEMHWLSDKEKVPGVAVSKEGHVDSLLGHEETHHCWSPWKKCKCKEYFLLLTPLAKFTLFIKWPNLITTSRMWHKVKF